MRVAISCVLCAEGLSDLPEFVLRLPLFRGMVLSYVSARLRLDTHSAGLLMWPAMFQCRRFVKRAIESRLEPWALSV